MGCYPNDSTPVDIIVARLAGHLLLTTLVHSSNPDISNVFTVKMLKIREWRTRGWQWTTFQQEYPIAHWGFKIRIGLARVFLSKQYFKWKLRKFFVLICPIIDKNFKSKKRSSRKRKFSVVKNVKNIFGHFWMAVFQTLSYSIS